jgi:uncharacterized protein
MADRPKDALIWAEIPVTDMDRARVFYEAVFGWEMVEESGGPNPMLMFTVDQGGRGGHLYPGTPATDGAGPTVHLAVPDTVEAALDRVAQAGGRALREVIPLPIGRFAYSVDPDGNSIGLFEPKG